MTHTPLTLLLVEDNPTDVHFLHTVLADVDAGAARLVHVDCLSAAVSQLREERFDVVLLDFFLPDSQGLDTFFVLPTSLTFEEEKRLQEQDSPCPDSRFSR